MNDLEKSCTELAKSVLLNRKIIAVRYLTDEEQSAFGWRSKCVVIQLDDNSLVFPSMDDEGNNAGALHFMKDGTNEHCIPVIY